MVRKRVFDYVDFFERYSPNRFPKEFEERDFVAATYAWDGTPGTGGAYATWAPG